MPASKMVSYFVITHKSLPSSIHSEMERFEGYRIKRKWVYGIHSVSREECQTGRLYRSGDGVVERSAHRGLWRRAVAEVA